MSGMAKKVVLIIKGDKQVTDIDRFRFLTIFMGIVHLILAGIGMRLTCQPVIIFSILIATVEISMLCAVRHMNNFLLGISTIYFATCFYSLTACIFLGWTFGFALYKLAIVPVLYYMIYMTKSISNSKRYALFYAIINGMITLMIRGYMYHRKPIYRYEGKTAFYISFFNHVVCFAFVIIFSTLFILELTRSREKLEKQAEELKHLADYDELTKLRNRRSMLDIWKRLGRNDYCVVMGDIDDFKKINDTYGHENGDDVLKLVANSMQEAIDSIDYVSRWGGEEFLMIVFGNLAYALKVIDKVQRELKNANLIVEGQRVEVTMTFGISECAGEQKGDIDELIRQADRRLYIGKHSGKNCIKIKDE